MQRAMGVPVLGLVTALNGLVCWAWSGVRTCVVNSLSSVTSRRV